MNQSLFLLQCVGYHAYYGLQGPQVLGLAWILQNRKWRAAAMAHHCTDLVAIVVALPAENCSGGPECIKSMKPGTYINILTLFFELLWFVLFLYTLDSNGNKIIFPQRHEIPHET